MVTPTVGMRVRLHEWHDDSSEEEDLHEPEQVGEVLSVSKDTCVVQLDDGEYDSSDDDGLREVTFDQIKEVL